MHIEIKIALWKRINIPKELEKVFRNKVMNYEITNSEQAIFYLNDYVDIKKEKFGALTELISPEQNNGEGTFQMFDKHDNLIYSNDIEEDQRSVG